MEDYLEIIDDILVRRYGLTARELGFDDEFIAAGWLGFENAWAFVNALEEEHMLGSRLDYEFT